MEYAFDLKVIALAIHLAQRSLGPVGKCDRAFHGVNHAFGVQSRFSTKIKRSFLGCSGPLDNARTIPEWLKNNFWSKKIMFFHGP